MSFIINLQRVREILERLGRVSTRALERELEISGGELDELIEELVEVQQVARREGRILAWVGGSPPADDRRPPPTFPAAVPALAQHLLHAGTADRGEARKVVTIVFADLIGSTALHERLDAESVRRVMERYYRALQTAVETHGGTIVKLLGDGVMAAFGVPRVAEDDAIRAVRAAVAIGQAVRDLGVGGRVWGVGTDTRPPTPHTLSVRVAVNTGEVVVSTDNTDIVGDPVNVAARLQQEARDGDVLIGEATQRLVGDLVTLAPAGTFALKGRCETVNAYRVVSLERPASAHATAFVGRDAELRQLFSVYTAAVSTPSARLAVLLGSPGLGKSRLLDEFTQRASDRATVLTARCDAAGGGTFIPIADALRTFLRIEEGVGGDGLRAAIDAAVPGDEAERTRIATGIGALFSGAPSSLEETFFAVRRLLSALAAVRPVVLVIDDLHWAEPLLLDLVEHLVQWSTGIPLFLLVAARPELREARSSLATPGPLVADVITLGGLDANASMQLAAGVVGAAELPAALVGRVLATSEGNPLFLAELVRMLVYDGTLVRQGERWVTTVEVATLDMPPTIHVLLAARIERLRPEERSVIERAAVIGRQFSRAAVAHLLGATPDLDARLEALRRSELVEPDTGWFLGEPAVRFHHVLIRDAAYRRVLKETRAELHERLADWIISRAGEGGEHDETIGFHLEQAHQNRFELGPLDTHGRALGERAARHLGAAGRRALARDELLPAASLLGRAFDRLGTTDPGRADLVLHWCEALLGAGDVGHATRALGELGRWIGDTASAGPGEALFETPPDEGGPSGRTVGSSSQKDISARAEKAATSQRSSRSPACLRAWHACFAAQLAALTDPQALRASEGAVEAAAETLAAAGEAKAHAVHALVLAQLGKIGACEAALDRALGITAAQAGALLARALVALGRIDEADAVSRESESLAGDSFQAAIAWRGVRAEVLAARGKHAAAIELARAAVEIAAATDDLLDHADARASLAVALRAAGRNAEADAEERRAVELWEAKGATLLVERAGRERTGTTPAAPEAAVPKSVEAVASPRVARRRMQPNYAILHLERIDEAVAARDAEAVRRLLGDTQTLDHTSGRSYGPDEAAEGFRWTIERSGGLAYGNQPIAALGPSLALARWREPSSGVVGDDLPIGPFEIEGTVLIDADAKARSTGVEIFGDKLGDAVVRLYERYAELLPEGRARRALRRSRARSA